MSVTFPCLSSNFKKQPCRILNRLVFTFIGLLVGALTFAMVVLLVQRIRDVENRLVDETMVRAKAFGIMMAPSLEFDEPSEARNILSHFSTDPNIEAAQVINADGAIFAAFGEMGTAKEETGRNGHRHTIHSNSIQVSAPVLLQSKPIGEIVLQISLKELSTEIKQSILTNLFVGIAIVCLSVSVLLKVAESITAPISSLALTAAEIAETSDYSLRAKKHAEDEIGSLADHFNRMLETIQEQRKTLEEQHEKLAASERLESLGLLAGGVAHDLNNILGPLVAMPELILNDLDDDHPAREDIRMMGKSAHRAGVVIQDLLSLARRGVYTLEKVDLNELVKDCLSYPAIEQRLEDAPGVICKLDLSGPDHAINGSEPHLTQVILNLAINAIEAMGQSVSEGVLTLKTETVTLTESLTGYETIPAGDYMMLEVADQGPGLSLEGMKRIFEPFYTSKKMGSSGSGLGLAVVYGVVHDHGGYLDVISKPGCGATFRLYLQMFQAADDTNLRVGDEAQEPDKTSNSKQARILVVDDYDPQRLLTEKLLESLGHQTESATDGRAALAKLEEDSRYDIMVVDMIMEEGFDGLDTIRGAMEINPDIRCIIATGFSETSRVETALELGACACLNKPYTVNTLSKAIRGALKDEVSLVS